MTLKKDKDTLYLVSCTGVPKLNDVNKLDILFSAQEFIKYDVDIFSCLVQGLKCIFQIL